MSNALAIATVTQSLLYLITNEIATDPNSDVPTGIKVTAQPPDIASNNRDTYQVNFFLYHIVPNAAWRNRALPTPAPIGADAPSPLALNLYYMVTAYARDSSDISDITVHNLLGRVMRILYDHPVLAPSDITPLDSDLQNQIERVRITLQPLSQEEVFRLWSGLQTEYRTSVTYEVGVVLIESTKSTSNPMPVLKIGRDRPGPDGKGPFVWPGALPYPTLLSIQVANVQMPIPPINLAVPNPLSQPPTALLGDTLVLTGTLLSPPSALVVVSFTSQRLTVPNTIIIPSAANTGTTINVALPTTGPQNWPAGFYTLTVVITSADSPPQTTNALTFSVAPQIDSILPTRDGSGNITIALSSHDLVFPEQQVSLIVGSQEFPMTPQSTATTNLSFACGHLPSGTYVLRLRVDGVDSFPFARSTPFNPYTNPPAFDPNQKVTIV